MNVIDFLKKGSGIHIKKENRGKFTDYCGGKVTSACIQKGKNSLDPAVRKRATFAANARKWKHQWGGNIRTQEEVNAINNSNKNKAKGLFKGMISGNILPTMENIGNMIGSAYNGWINPQTTYIAGEPSVLPGRVNMSLYKNAKGILKGPQTDEGFVNFVERLSKGRVKPEFVTKNGKVSPAHYNYVDLKSEVTSKGFVKGNEVTPDLRHSISEEGLTSRIAKPFVYENPITNEAEAAAAKDWLEMMKPKRGGRPVGSKNKPKQPVAKKIEPKYTQSGTSEERFMEGLEYNISKKGKVSTIDKYERAYQKGDARITNSGNTRLKKAQLNQIKMNYNKYPRWERDNFEKVLKNLYRRNRPKSEINSAWKNHYWSLADKYGFYKEGGILKSQEGSKIDPQLISGLANGIMNFATTFTQNKVLDNQAKAQKAQNEQEWAQIVKEIVKQNQLKRAQNFQQWMSDYQQGLTLDNPSQIVENHLGYKQLQDDIISGKQSLKNKNAQIDTQVASEKSNNLIDAFGGLMQIGTTALLNYKPKQNNTSNKGADISSTSFYKPDSSSEIYTTKSGISNTVDDWRKFIGV